MSSCQKIRGCARVDRLVANSRGSHTGLELARGPSPDLDPLLHRETIEHERLAGEPTDRGDRARDRARDGADSRDFLFHDCRAGRKQASVFRAGR